MRRLDLARLPSGWGADMGGPHARIYDARQSHGLLMCVRSLGVFRRGQQLEVGEVLTEQVWCFRGQAIDALRICLVDEHQGALEEARRLGLCANSDAGSWYILGPGVKLKFEEHSGFRLIDSSGSANCKAFARFIAWVTKNGYTEV